MSNLDNLALLEVEEMDSLELQNVEGGVHPLVWGLVAGAITMAWSSIVEYPDAFAAGYAAGRK